MQEFEHGGHRYRIRKFNALEQWNLSRKIAPLIPPLVPVFIKISKAGGLTKDLTGVAEVLTPFAEGISALSDETSEWIINTCLSALSREVAPGTTGAAWTKIWSSASKISQFEEINDLSTVVPLVMKVIWETLGPFISGLLTAQQSEDQAETPTAATS